VLNKMSKILAPLIPFATEKIYQDITNSKDSVHIQNYPKIDESLINKNLEEEMEITRNIVSAALRQRDKEHIGIKWPLGKAIVSTPIQPNEELSSIIKEELNIKEIEYKKSETLEVILDTNITPELEAEGYAREISRKIQATRKKNDLVKSDIIELEIISEFNDILKSQLDSIKTKVGAKTISLEKSNKDFSYSEVGKIKNKTFEIRFNEL
jgi:isoleucyl-tRNA synthetase